MLFFKLCPYFFGQIAVLESLIVLLAKNEHIFLRVFGSVFLPKKRPKIHRSANIFSRSGHADIKPKRKTCKNANIEFQKVKISSLCTLKNLRDSRTYIIVDLQLAG